MLTELDIISVAQAAQELGISEKRIREYCRSGKLKAHNFGGQWLIPRDAWADFKQNTYTGKHGRPKKGDS
jgi:excisionase family DNA binding protein